MDRAMFLQLMESDGLIEARANWTASGKQGHRAARRHVAAEAAKAHAASQAAEAAKAHAASQAAEAAKVAHGSGRIGRTLAGAEHGFNSARNALPRHSGKVLAGLTALVTGGAALKHVHGRHAASQAASQAAEAAKVAHGKTLRGMGERAVGAVKGMSGRQKALAGGLAAGAGALTLLRRIKKHKRTRIVTWAS